MPCEPCKNKLPSASAMAANVAKTIGAVAMNAMAGNQTIVEQSQFNARLAICKSCECYAEIPSRISGNLWPRCLECGCWLDAKHKIAGKAWLKVSKCPLAKWGAA